MTTLPTVDDVAREAGVSRQTVSNVLNAPQVVRDATRERVQTAIDRLGYRPHGAARRLRTRQSATIGIRLSPVDRAGVSGSVLDRFVHELAEQAALRGHRLTLFSAVDAEDEIEQYRALRDGADADAVIVTGTGFDDPRVDWLVRERMPFVAFGRPWGPDLDDPARPWVDVDGAAGTRAATEHLRARGLERIGWLGWPSGSGTGDDRRRGWREASRTSAPELVSEEGVATARAVVERALDGRSPGEAGLDGLVCASDSLALGAMMAVREAGHPRFPIVGFDDTPVAQAVGLSSVDQRTDLVARAVLDLLLGAGGRVLAPGDPSLGDPHRLVEPQLVVRRSNTLLAHDPEAAGHDPRSPLRKDTK